MQVSECYFEKIYSTIKAKCNIKADGHKIERTSRTRSLTGMGSLST